MAKVSKSLRLPVAVATRLEQCDNQSVTVEYALRDYFGMDENQHPEHGEIIEDVLNTPKHDNELVYRCTRCNTIVPRDEFSVFDEQDCDENKRVTEGITENL